MQFHLSELVKMSASAIGGSLQVLNPEYPNKVQEHFNQNSTASSQQPDSTNFAQLLNSDVKTLTLASNLTTLLDCNNLQLQIRNGH
jgi:hypothetical protein